MTNGESGVSISWRMNESVPMIFGRTRCVASMTALLALSCGSFAQEGATPVNLSSIQQVLSLPSQAFQQPNFSATLRGVVIYASPPTRRLYIQEGEQGLQVNLAGSIAGFHPGQLVEVTGTVEQSIPFPRLLNAAARVLDEVPLPTPKPSHNPTLRTGGDAFRLVSVRGVVRDMVADRASVTLLLTEEDEPFELLIPQPVTLPRDLIDAEVEVHGLSYPFYNSRLRPTGFRLHAQSLDMIRIIHPGVTNQFDRPLMTIAEAARLPDDWRPRVRVAGTVTVHRPGGGALFLEDGTGVIQIYLMTLLPPPPPGGQQLQHEPQAWLQPGERVEVIGLRHNLHSLTPTLINAEYRRLGEGALPKPRNVSLADLQAGRFAGHVVSIEARLLDHLGWGIFNRRNESLTLQSGEHVFQAIWESELPATWDLKPNSYVRVTGVNMADQGQFKSRPSFQIVMRSPADVEPAPEPPFWTRPEFRRVGLGAGAVGLIAGAWIIFQRFHLRRLEHRVTERTTKLRQEVTARELAESELRVALASEKELNQLKSNFVSMVSHEFRTPLEVILSSSNILDRYLERLSPDKRKGQLRAIRKAVRRMNDLVEDVLLLGKFDADRMSCSPVPLKLAAACRRIAVEVETAAERDGAIRFQAEEPEDDANVDESLLDHILTNLLGNALKYSPASCPVDFILKRAGADAVFVIRDCGCGIPAADQPRLFTAFYRGANVSQTPGSGLGLVIVKRCVDLHDGTIQCASEEGRGTTFTVTLPVFDATRKFRRKLPTPMLSTS